MRFHGGDGVMWPAAVLYGTDVAAPVYTHRIFSPRDSFLCSSTWPCARPGAAANCRRVGVRRMMRRGCIPMIPFPWAFARRRRSVPPYAPRMTTGCPACHRVAAGVPMNRGVPAARLRPVASGCVRLRPGVPCCSAARTPFPTQRRRRQPLRAGAPCTTTSSFISITALRN